MFPGAHCSLREERKASLRSLREEPVVWLGLVDRALQTQLDELMGGGDGEERNDRNDLGGRQDDENVGDGRSGVPGERRRFR